MTLGSQQGEPTSPSASRTALTLSPPCSYAGLLSATFGGAALFANVLVLSSGRVKREGGWRLVAWLAALHAVWMVVAVAMVAREFSHGDGFYYRSRLGESPSRPDLSTQVFEY